MNFILDTHVLIWYAEADARLPDRIRDMIRNPNNVIWVSYASIWEMAIKISIGKLNVRFTLPEWEQLLVQNGFSICQAGFTHYEALLHLPWHHNDPFDRLIIAQSLVEQFTIITHDQHFKQYHLNLEFF